MGSGLWVDPDELDGSWASDPNAGEAVAMASHVIWSLSGRKYTRARTVTETYECACVTPGRWVLPGRWSVVPVIESGAFYNVIEGSCGCRRGQARLRLRGTPVRSVQEVRRGGSVLGPESYRVENGAVLVLDQGVPGRDCGIDVTYTHGTGIPGGGRVSVKLLAQEFLKAWSGDDDCRLPDRVTNVSRQGISFTVLDRQEFLDDLRTGILEVDLFLRSVNPDRARKPARVFSADVPRGARVGGNGPVSAPSPGVVVGNLTVPQGSDWAYSWAVTYQGEPIHPSEWTARAQVRPAPGSSVLLHEFYAAVTTQGAVVIRATGAESSGWAWTSGRYDVEVTRNAGGESGPTFRVSQGTVTVDQEVTV